VRIGKLAGRRGTGLGTYGVVLVKGDEDERVLHELGVVEERGEEVVGPGAGHGHGSVVAVARHVGRDEHPAGDIL